MVAGCKTTTKIKTADGNVEEVDLNEFDAIRRQEADSDAPPDRWVEVSRVTETVEINDETSGQAVAEFERILEITYQREGDGAKETRVYNHPTV